MNEQSMLYVMSEMEKKLKELMPPDEYAAFSVKLAKETFMKEVDGMAECEFKEFIIDNFDTITGNAGEG